MVPSGHRSSNGQSPEETNTCSTENVRAHTNVSYQGCDKGKRSRAAIRTSQEAVAGAAKLEALQKGAELGGLGSAQLMRRGRDEGLLCPKKLGKGLGGIELSPHLHRARLGPRG